MTFLLDTSICVEILRGRDRLVRERLFPRLASCRLCDVVIAELVFGFVKSPDTHREQKTRDLISTMPSLPIGYEGALAYARLRAELERRGEVIGANDMLIAATALAHDATLVTRNEAEFGRIGGLRVEGWRG